MLDWLNFFIVFGGSLLRRDDIQKLTNKQSMKSKQKKTKRV